LCVAGGWAFGGAGGLVLAGGVEGQFAEVALDVSTRISPS
jgi:hypothetical protein